MQNEAKRGWTVPLWLSVPVVMALWLSSWISSMDPTGSHGANTILWMLTFGASLLLVLQRR